jgi:tRNA(His) 5'-end guanylyltransferase
MMPLAVYLSVNLIINSYSFWILAPYLTDTNEEYRLAGTHKQEKRG